MIITFSILSAIAVISALLAVRLRNLVHATLTLMAFFVALAGLFILLMAEFLAAVQILVYVGAVGILILFAIMLTQQVTGNVKEHIEAHGALWGLAGATAVLLTLLLPAILKTALPLQPVVETIDPSVRALGLNLMAPYTIALQVIALLLTAALLGAVVIAISPEKSEEEKKS